jgi:hypothetical protein
MTNHHTSSRRAFLRQGAFGLGPLALAWMLDRDRAFANPPKPALEPPTFDTLPKAPRAPARATAMISLWMQGGPSHHDLFDPKPEMAKWEASFPVRSNTTTRAGQLQGSRREFAKRRMRHGAVRNHSAHQCDRG